MLMAAGTLFLFLVFKGVKRLIRHNYRDHREMNYRHEGKMSRMKMKSERKTECGIHEARCCEMEHGHSDSSHTYFETSTDTIDGKIIRKETEIIKK